MLSTVLVLGVLICFRASAGQAVIGISEARCLSHPKLSLQSPISGIDGLRNGAARMLELASDFGFFERSAPCDSSFHFSFLISSLINKSDKPTTVKKNKRD